MYFSPMGVSGDNSIKLSLSSPTPSSCGLHIIPKDSTFATVRCDIGFFTPATLHPIGASTPIIPARTFGAQHTICSVCCVPSSTDKICRFSRAGCGRTSTIFAVIGVGASFFWVHIYQLILQPFHRLCVKKCFLEL